MKENEGKRSKKLKEDKKRIGNKLKGRKGRKEGRRRMERGEMSEGRENVKK